MTSFLCISIQFLEPMFHGREEGGRPEWPPSPLRLFQAIVAAGGWKYPEENQFKKVQEVLQLLESLPAPEIFTPQHRPGTPYRLYCPDNLGDRVASSWSRGGTASLADSRTEKDVCPTHMLDGNELHYLWPMTEKLKEQWQTLRDLVRSVTCLGWGIDHVVADACEMNDIDVASLSGVKWLPGESIGTSELRCPKKGTLDALLRRHTRFLRRIDRDERGEEFFNPVPALTTFQLIQYRPDSQTLSHPYAVFQLQGDADARPFSYSQSRFIHIAGMVRHLAIEALKRSPPRDVDDGWVEKFVAGHANGQVNHQQFSYVPLPSFGHQHADQAIRRMMIVAPHGTQRWLDHLVNLLAGQQLIPAQQTQLKQPPTLVHVRGDNVTRCYTTPSTHWASVTPIILPGHDDHRPAKTRKLIEKALLQSGIEQECEFDWSPFPYFPKSLTAHKHGRDKRPSGYIRPNHLLNQTAVHLKLAFRESVFYPGPLTIGAGRHCGFGLMAAVRS